MTDKNQCVSALVGMASFKVSGRSGESAVIVCLLLLILFK